MEIKSLENLERQINRMLDRFKAVKAERDELALRVEQLETEVAALNQSDDALKEELQKARRLKSDPRKEEQIKAKIDELLAKLEGL